MKRIHILIILTIISLIACVFYLLPAYLKHRDIQSAQADLQLISSENTQHPAGHLSNGYHALWMLPYRTHSEAERTGLMEKYQDALHNTDVEIPQELQALALPLPQNEEMRCDHDAAKCLSEIRAKLPEYRQAVYQYRDIIRNIDALADYETFYFNHPLSDDLSPFKTRLPQLNLLSYAPQPLPSIGQTSNTNKPCNEPAAKLNQAKP